MRALPTTPPARMSFPMALAYARRGYAIRPLSWTGAGGGAHALAWLIYPAGAPLARYMDESNPHPGRPWKAGDLARADWFAWWTCLPVDCFTPDETTGETPACLCEGGEAAFQWSFTAFEEDETAFDGVENPNQYLGLKSCSAACDCEASTTGTAGTGTAGTGTTGTGSGSSGTGTTTGTGSGGTGAGSGSSGNPRPGNPGTGAGSASGSGGSPLPVSSGGSGGGGGGGGGGSRKRRRREAGGNVGPTITLTPLLTDPEGCQLGADPVEHTWSIGVELSAGAHIADAIYSVQLRVLGTLVDSWMLAPGGTATAEYVATIAPDAAARTAICTGSAFGGGPACVSAEADLEPAGICGESSSSTSSTSSSSSSVSSSSGSGSSSTTSSTTSSSSPGFYGHTLAYDPSAGPGGACLVWPTAVEYFSDLASLAYGAYLYTDSGGTTAAADGYYSDGTTWYQVGSGQISASGSC